MRLANGLSNGTLGRASPATATLGAPPSVRLLLAVALLPVVAALLAFAWTGFIVSDDQYYVQSALGWRDHFPYVAQHFGTSRAVVGIPIAASIQALGYNEFAVVFSSLVFFGATVLASFAALCRVLPAAQAFAIAAGMSTVPLFALKATIPSADLPELFFVTLSFWLFWRAIEAQRGRVPALLLSGVAAGLAFSAHEVTAALLLFYGALLVRGYRIARPGYLLIGAGFAAVLLGEALYYAVVAGAPLHRWQLLVTATAINDRVVVDRFQFAAGGTLHVWEPLDPLLMLFLKHDFALLGWVALPAVWWAFVTARRDGGAVARLVRLLTGLAFTWAVFAAVALHKLILLPRYYMVTAWALYLAGAVWLLAVLAPRRAGMATAVVLAALLANFAAIAVDNKNPRFGERALADYLRDRPGPLRTDPLTANNVQWFCDWQGVDCRSLVAKPPVAGGLYFHNPANAGRSNRFVPADQLRRWRPDPAWRVVWSRTSPPPAWAAWLERSGVTRWLPPAIAAKIAAPRPAVTVFEAGADAANRP